MQTVKIINTATWQGDSEKTKESPRQLPPRKHSQAIKTLQPVYL